MCLLAGGAAAGAEGPAAASSDLDVLRADLEAAVAAYGGGGEYAVAVTDLQTGETVSVNGERWHLSACSINVLLLVQTALDLQSGRVTLAQVDDLVKRTVWSSNATAARDLYGVIGGGHVAGGVFRVERLVGQLGLTRTVLDHPPGFGEWSLGKHASNWLSAEDANRVMAAVWSGDLLDDERRAWLLDRLTQVKPGLNYLTAITPGATVSHKNGFFPALGGTYVDNDVAIVRLTAGGVEVAYALSFFSQYVPQEYADIPLGQAVTMRAHEFFRARYGY